MYKEEFCRYMSVWNIRYQLKFQLFSQLSITWLTCCCRPTGKRERATEGGEPTTTSEPARRLLSVNFSRF